uniref:Uncharacterized protein n=1 Tax=viral metagenome TaxID=1070528 RepID=A0A6C0I7Z3_9ZZZZ
MAAEREILYKMKTTASIFLNTLKQVRKLKAEIDKNIELNMDNNYFVEKQTTNKDFNEVFDIKSIDEVINIVEPLIDEIMIEREKICENHEYIEDQVETGIECNMMTIYYCKFCHVTRMNE